MHASLKNYKTNLLRSVEQTITTYGMLKPDDAVVVGVSGGPDSVALLHILNTLAPRFSLRIGVAHLNHCLRQTASDRDAEFVGLLAKKLDLPCFMQKVDVRKYQADQKLSLEEAARRVRYTFYNEVSKTNRFNKIALGHHGDDNAEQVLMNLFRGSGPLGIAGIPPMRNRTIIRPLIQSKRIEIVKFLDKNKIPYIADISNTDTRYLRNRIRHQLIPLLKTAYNPKIIETLVRTAEIIRAEEERIEAEIDLLFKKTALNIQQDHVTFALSRLNDIHISTQRRLFRKAIETIKGDLRRIRFSHVDSVVRLLKSGQMNARLDFPNRIRVQQDQEGLRFSREKIPLRHLDPTPESDATPAFEYAIATPGSIFIKEIDSYIHFSKLSIENLPEVRHAGRNTAFFDQDAIHFPLLLRYYRPGDRFKPMGMAGTQPLKKFFIDKKVPKGERAKCPLLLSRGKIIWVVGHRIDESVKITPSTRNVLKVDLSLAY